MSCHSKALVVGPTLINEVLEDIRKKAKMYR